MKRLFFDRNGALLRGYGEQVSCFVKHIFFVTGAFAVCAFQRALCEEICFFVFGFSVYSEESAYSEAYSN